MDGKTGYSTSIVVDQPQQFTSKKYVDDADALKLNLSGGTMTGTLTLSGAPSSDLHAATKLYVDG